MITWTSYLMGSFILTTAYYTIVYFLFYKKGRILRPTAPLKASITTVNVNNPKNQERVQPLDAATAAPMHSLVDELQACIAQAGQEGAEKEALFVAVVKVIQKYPGIKGSVFQEGITNLIAVTAENICDVHFTADDLQFMWQ